MFRPPLLMSSARERCASKRSRGDSPIVKATPIVSWIQRERRADLSCLMPFAGNSEWPLAHAVEHALALANGARQQHLVIDIEQLIAA